MWMKVDLKLQQERDPAKICLMKFMVHRPATGTSCHRSIFISVFDKLL